MFLGSVIFSSENLTGSLLETMDRFDGVRVFGINDFVGPSRFIFGNSKTQEGKMSMPVGHRNFRKVKLDNERSDETANSESESCKPRDSSNMDLK